MRYLAAIIATLAVAPTCFAQGTTAVEDQIAPALSAAGLTTLSARFDPGLMRIFRSAEFTTPLYSAASINPWQAPFLFNVFTNDVDAQAGKPNEILNVGARYVGTGSRRTLIGDPLAAARLGPLSPQNAFFRERAYSDESRGRTLVAPQGDIPPEVQGAAALILRALRQTKEPHTLFRNSIFSSKTQGLTNGSQVQEIVLKGLEDDAPLEDFSAALDIFQKADVRYLMAGANDLALAVQDASKMVANAPATAAYWFDMPTAFGHVILSGGVNNVYKPSDAGTCCLIIDTSGNDTYIDTPMVDGKFPDAFASIVIDTNGNDKYLSDPALETQDVASFKDRKNPGIQPGPCGALMGYAFLFDLKGDDLYRSSRCGIASGRLGVAVLEDAEGNDTYDGYADSVGFGMFGAGILEDMSGNDTYSGFTQVQGVGQTAGFGALIDHGGNDTYVANDTVIDFPSAQSAEHNNSMSQGAGNGTRRDYLDAHQLAGGIGLLLDDAGDDKYSGAVFAQACGYLEGIGIRRDKAGTDTYNGMWYVQGASAHFAVGYLQDDEGDDHYAATMNMAQGAGHDFGAGYLLDLAGNDTYVAPNLSLGAGNANGIGLLLEASGNDSYTSSGLTLGQSGEAPKGSLRERALCLGIFTDLAGTDTYPPAFAWAKNGATQINWTGKQRTPEESQFGVFYDR